MAERVPYVPVILIPEVHVRDAARTSIGEGEDPDGVDEAEGAGLQDLGVLRHGDLDGLVLSDLVRLRLHYLEVEGENVVEKPVLDGQVLLIHGLGVTRTAIGVNGPGSDPDDTKQEMQNGHKTAQKRRVIDELKRRAAKEKPLNSGANRGDWLYAAAVLQFGSWGAAVEAAGFDYSAIKIRPMTEHEVIEEIRELSAAGDQLFARDHRKLATAALRIFGSWNDAIVAAGCEIPDRRTWTRETVIDAIKEDLEKDVPLNATAVIARNGGLYKAGRKLFGSWAAAFDAATVKGSRRKRTGISPTSVQRLRRKLGIDHHEFGEKVGVSGKTVAKWETDGVSPSSWGYIPVRQLINESSV